MGVMMINKLAKVISAAAVLTMAVSLAPQSALAQKFSGQANNVNDRFSFEINPSASYTGGIFSGAIQNAIYTDNDSLAVLNAETPKDYKLNQGDLKVSLESISDSLQQALNVRSSSFKGKFGSTVVKYEARLEDNSNPKNFIHFAFYAPYTEPFTNLNSLSIFNASNLTPFLDSSGSVSFPKYLWGLKFDDNLEPNPFNEDDYRTFDWTPDSDRKKVLEPAATISLLVFGIVSTTLLRKRNKRPEINLSNAKKTL
ncbi:hypothetical protein DP113_15115 [Brasilonema octagenarum UFV-E1]|uniref:PEP-CTERM sorting domain-containing protein n=4 Tax=Brasilonema TaxID=383614 RepID=A0A856MHD8_9CYAN|nr:hypothetical protein [Brasilonema octagenarum UFV-OR1]QDL09061.1 hypothetical protein DP114_15175 [Brasilonema sennae CENA114]QDL15419.1 hypothetical protein DP113_15115 [Brasilonema octagenarum UFV-E1]